MHRCLLIDDDAFFQRVTADILLQGNIQTDCADTGREGWHRYITGSYDLIVLDLQLPDVSGYELLDRLVGRDAASKAIVVTSSFSLDSALKVLRAGAGDYLPKPFSGEALLTSVERVLHRSRLRQENQALQNQLRERVEELKTMRFVAQLVVSTRPMSECIREVVDAVCNWLGAEAGALLLLDESGEKLVFEEATGPAGAAVSKMVISSSQRALAWACLEKGEALLVEDAQKDERFGGEVDLLTGYQTRDLIAAPIMVQDRPVGVIEVINKKGAAGFTPRDLSRLDEISSSIAVAVLNASMVERLQKSQAQLAEWNQKLEQLVEERTSKLTDSEQKLREAYQQLLQSHDKLQQMQAALLEREKTAALGLLSAGVAHEINNPLSFVRANLENLKNYVRSARQMVALLRHASSRLKAGDQARVAALVQEAQRLMEQNALQEIDDEMAQIFDETAEGVERIAYVVEQLRYFSQDAPSSEQPQPTDLVAEIKRTAELLGFVRAQKGLPPFEMRLASLPAVSVPVRTVRQILVELLGAEFDDNHNRQVILSCGISMPVVWLEIFHTRTILDEAEIANLFDPFFKPARYKGNGGLSLCAASGLARRLGGNVKAFLDGHGLRLRLELPACCSS